MKRKLKIDKVKKFVPLTLKRIALELMDKVNPDTNSMVVGFQDRNILHNAIRSYVPEENVRVVAV